MKLYFHGHNYKYAVEQMLLTLFPSRRPKYPSVPPGPGDSWASLRLTRGAVWITASAEVCVEGARCRRMCRTRAADPDGKPAEDRVLQHIVAQAFYRAATSLLGAEPPWGMLTGVRPVKLPVRAMEQGADARQAEAMLCGQYRVSAPRAALAADCAMACLKVKKTLRPGEISLYAGIPFCPSRCAYCSFISSAVGSSLKLTEPYLEALFQEIESAGRAAARTKQRVRSAYIGGGTPTTLSAAQLARLMQAVSGAFDLTRCTEFTVEAGRPDTITREKLEAILAGGGNRISVNPQTLSDSVLHAIGRNHTARDFLRAYDMAREVGGLAINTDLIAGLPGDSAAGFRRSLDTVLSLAPENVTVHTLARKRGSRLIDEECKAPGGGEVEVMLDYAQDALRAAGYRPYYLYRQKFMSGAFENVGWSMPGYESVYNICMMEEVHTVLALGAGGASKLVDGGTGRIRRVLNPKYPQDYIRGLPAVIAGKERIFITQEVPDGISVTGN